MNDELPGAIEDGLHIVRQLYDREFEPLARPVMPESVARWRGNVHDALERTQHAVAALSSAAYAEERSRLAREAVLSIVALDAQLTSIAAQINIAQTGGHILASVGATLTSLINNIKAVVQGISAQIMQLIANRVTPSGWAIAGGLGTNLFGLQGNIQIEIQFT